MYILKGDMYQSIEIRCDQTVTKKLGKKLTGKHTIYFEFDTLDVRMDSWSFKK